MGDFRKNNKEVLVANVKFVLLVILEKLDWRVTHPLQHAAGTSGITSYKPQYQ